MPLRHIRWIGISLFGSLVSVPLGLSSSRGSLRSGTKVDCSPWQADAVTEIRRSSEVRVVFCRMEQRFPRGIGILLAIQVAKSAFFRFGERSSPTTNRRSECLAPWRGVYEDSFMHGLVVSSREAQVCFNFLRNESGKADRRRRPEKDGIAEPDHLDQIR